MVKSALFTDDSGELLSRFLSVALENGLPGNGIMEAGLNILQKLPSRHPGLFDGALHLSGRVIRNFTGHAAEPGLFRRRIVQSPRHLFERTARAGYAANARRGAASLADLIASGSRARSFAFRDRRCWRGRAFSFIHKIIFGQQPPKQPFAQNKNGSQVGRLASC